MNYKVGFIGFGGMISGYHYVTISRDDIPFDATAAFDIDPEARANAEAKGLRVFDNPEDFFAYGGYDLVVVGTANNYHAEMACRAKTMPASIACGAALLVLALAERGSARQGVFCFTRVIRFL